MVIMAVTPLTPGDEMAAQSGTGTAIETTEGGGLLGQVEVHSIDWIPDPERHG